MSKNNLEKKFVDTSFGRIAYLESGNSDKPPVLFIHGIPTSGYLWRDVIRFLQNDLHCYAPDLMGLGDTEVDPDNTEFHMEAQAEMLMEFMEAVGHKTYGMVCHDQGGAAAQIIVGRQPDRIDAWVITDMVCYDNWPVPAVKRLQNLSRIPLLADFFTRSGLGEWLECSTPLSNFRRGVFQRERFSDESIREYMRPLRSGNKRRAAFKNFLLAGSPRFTELAVDGIRAFEKPTMVIWAADDHYLSPSWGKKLAEDIPGVKQFELVPFCGHFWQEERPSEFSGLMGKFLTVELAKARSVQTEAETVAAEKSEKAAAKTKDKAVAARPKTKKKPAKKAKSAASVTAGA